MSEPDTTRMTMISALFDAPFQWALICAVLFCATVVQGSVGFGFGLIAAPLFLLIQPQLLPGPLIIAALTLTVTMAIRGWRLVEYGVVPWLLLGFLPGLWLGATLLQHLSTQQTAFLFGFLVLSAVAISASGWQPQRKPHTLVPAGFFSAILSITTTMGGPPIALALQTMPGERFRYTLAFFFTLA
ncbi:MAG: sulfite exporter TauE/SafE family protein, partial [Magnetococcales bacterium]|nr:sulfite exporter TauE/SafE family protein [Magnetococcales bacterium]